MKNRREKIIEIFSSLLKESGIEVSDGFFDKNFELWDSGLSSLEFAVLVARLEEELQFDPFVEAEVPIYPTTFFEFVAMYEKG